MNNISLNLNSNVLKIPLVNKAQTLLDLFYNKVWDPNKTYSKGTYVIYNNVRYQSLIDENIGEPPITSLNWKAVTLWTDPFLQDTFNTGWELFSMIGNNFSTYDKLFIMNYVYHLKGDIISVREYCRIMDIDIEEIDYNLENLFITVNIRHLISTDPMRTQFYFEKLLNELLYYDGESTKVKNVTINCVIKNYITVLANTQIINNIGPFNHKDAEQT